MKYRKITGTDMQPSVICLGTAPAGTGLPEAEAFAMFDAYVEQGGNFLDTANVYGDWVRGTKSLSEKTIGKWLQQRGGRDKLYIGTKGGHPLLDAIHVSRLSPQDIVNDIDQSLQHLGTDYIDLYWLHRDDQTRPVGEIMEVLNEQIRAGKIRAIGCSNWTLQRIQEAQAYADAHALVSFVANQPMWSLAQVDPRKLSDQTLVVMDDQTRDYHEQRQMAAIPYSSQANGFFSGRYAKNIEPANKTVLRNYYSEVNFERLARVEKLAMERGLTQAQIALAYLLSQPYPVFPVIGARTLAQLSESVAAGDADLKHEDLAYLEHGQQ